MSPDSPQLPPKPIPLPVSQIGTGEPFGRSSRCSLPEAKKASDRPSGDQMIERAPSVPDSGWGASPPTARVHSRETPSVPTAMNASVCPSGAIARFTPSTSCGKTVAGWRCDLEANLRGRRDARRSQSQPRGRQADRRRLRPHATAAVRDRHQRGDRRRAPLAGSPCAMAFSSRAASNALCQRRCGSFTRQLRIRRSSAAVEVGSNVVTG